VFEISSPSPGSDVLGLRGRPHVLPGPSMAEYVAWPRLCRRVRAPLWWHYTVTNMHAACLLTMFFANHVFCSTRGGVNPGPSGAQPSKSGPMRRGVYN